MRRLARFDTPRGRQNVHHYVDEWLDYSHVEVASDAVRDGQMGPRMVQETEAFVEHVLYDQNGDIGDLLTSRSTMLDRSLSAFYGFGDVQSEQLVSVERPAHWGVGLLAQGVGARIALAPRFVLADASRNAYLRATAVSDHAASASGHSADRAAEAWDHDDP